MTQKGRRRRKQRVPDSSEPPVKLPFDEQPIVVHPPGLHGAADDDDGNASAAPLPAAEPAHAAARMPPAEAVPDVGPSQPAIPVAPPAVAEPVQRADSLDALRGLFLIVMTLGFTIQAGIFPDWMYHRQFPPPGDSAAIPGIAWRDLAYAAFLFTMAAALPITLGRRIARGETEIGIMFGVLRRGVLLFAFALLIGHSNTFFTGYTQEARVLAIIGFVIMALVFTRRRADWHEDRFRMVRRAGWIAAFAFLALSPLVYGEAFSPERRDQIMVSLMFAAVVGSVLWYLTRNNIPARLALLGAAMALCAAAQFEGPVQRFWWQSPVPWLFTPSYLVLLTVVVPGTIAGDLIVRWITAASGRGTDAARGWGRGRIALLALLAAATAPLVVIGLYNRWVLATLAAAAVLVAAGLALARGPANAGERMLRDGFAWASGWLLLGLLLDPVEGGISKVPETLSYFFTVSGVTMMLLVTLAAFVDMLGRQRAARPLIEVGQNPMIAYVMFTVLLNSVLELIEALRPVLRDSPGASLLRSLLMTALVVVIVQALTRHRIFWRT